MKCKTFFSVLLIDTVLFVLAGCSQEFPSEKINIRNGIAYKVNSDTPFSGVVVEKYKNGQIAYKTNYKDGKMDEEYVVYHKNGQIAYKTNYKDGKQVGECVCYYENGQIEYKGNYKDGEKDGEWVKYYTNGQIRGCKTFK